MLRHQFPALNTAIRSTAFAALLCAPMHLRSQSPDFRNNLMPQPASLTTTSGAFPLQSSLTVSLTGAISPPLQAYTLRTLKRLEDKTGTPFPRQLASTGSITLHVASAGPAIQTLDQDESYSLASTPTRITIEAATPLGAMHALETLLQLAQPSGNAYVIPAVTIHDSPRFHWRGLMIDCGRHFEPMDVLKRNLDAMAAVKLNVFHWHLTEDQGFRIESKLFPKLTQLGSDGLFYTQDDARELVRYAAARGIRVVPEFEMPGHSAAWLVAYPELSSGTVPSSIRRQFGISDSALDPTREETYKFIARFLGEMVTIFPDQYLHIGGDETPAPDWTSNPRIVAFKKQHNLADNDALQAYFNQRILKILTGLNRRMVGWDEILNPALPKSIVIQSWRGEASLAKAAEQGYNGVLSAPYYLDAMKPAGVHYLADPIPADTKLTPEQQKFILGGEVTMWAEHLDATTIDSRVWPRTAAIAERFWSPQSVRDVDDMYRRLTPVSLELETLGTRHLSSEGAALRSLAGTLNPDSLNALRTFAQAFEPVSFHERYQQQHTSQLTPLTGFVDAVVPDPPIRHQLELAAAVLIRFPHSTQPSMTQAFSMTQRTTTHARDTLSHFFQSVGSSVPEVRELIARNPRLEPITPRLEQLPALTQAGLEAISFLTSNTPAPTGWKSRNLALIEEAKKTTTPDVINPVRYTFLQPLTDLIKATPEK